RTLRQPELADVAEDRNDPSEYVTAAHHQQHTGQRLAVAPQGVRPRGPPFARPRGSRSPRVRSGTAHPAGRGSQPRGKTARRQSTSLTGGVAGARLLPGHRAATDPEHDEITVIGNTADDIWLFGLRVCHDLDTVMYTLGGGQDEER